MNNIQKNDLTSGPLFLKTVKFVLPLILTNLLQVLYNSADMIVVGLSSEPNAVGAVGATTSYIHPFVNLFIGFSVGTNVVVAKYIGQKNEKRISSAVHTAIIVSFLFGIVFGGMGILLQKPILTAMGYKGDLLRLSIIYVTIYFLGAPFLSLTNCLSSILRAEGDTKTPLYIMSGAGLLNVVLNIFFVLSLNMSVEGVAIATSVSSIVSSVLLILVLYRRKTSINFSPKKLCIDKHTLKRIIFIGLPAGVQGILFSISNMIILSSIVKVDNLITPVGVDFQPVVKANSAVSSLENFAYTATNSVSQAAVTFTSQNIGAKKIDRVKSVMKSCYSLTFIIAIITSGILILFRNPLLSLYGIKNDGAIGNVIAYDAAIEKFFILLPFYFFLGFMEVGSSILRGLGRSLTSTVVSLIGSCLLRIIWILTVFEAVSTLFVIYVSYPITWGLTALIHFICCTLILKKLLKPIKTDEKVSV